MIGEWLARQLDYALAWHGLTCLVLASMCHQRSRQQTHVPWLWLALFGVLHGLGNWLKLLTLGLPTSIPLQAGATAVLTVSWLPLVEFGRRAWPGRGRMTGQWIYAVLIGITMVGGLGGLNGLQAAAAWALGLPGAVLAGASLLLQSRNDSCTGHWRPQVAAAGLVIHSLAGGLGGTGFSISILAGSAVGQSVVNGSLPPLMQAFGALCMVATALALVCRQCGCSLESSTRVQRYFLAAAAIALLVAGAYATDWCGRLVDEDARSRLLSQAIRISETIDPDQVSRLSFTAQDKANPAFQRLRRQMIAFGQAIHQRSIYSIALRGENIVFGPENLAPDDPMASPPGTIYREPTAGNFRILATGIPYTDGPCTDEYGTFVSGYAPVREARTGRVLMVVGLDLLADRWQLDLTVARLGPILCTLTLVSMLLVGGGAVWFPSVLPDHFRTRWLRWLHAPGAASAVAFGLVATIALACLAHLAEAQTRRFNFSQTADGAADDVVQAMQTLRDSQLGGLARFLECSAEISREGFSAFAGPMARDASVRAFEWIPKVSAHERPAVEAAARQSGLDGFTISEKDPAGQRLPAGDRSVYYPVLYVEPLAGNESAVGFDLNSERSRRAAIQEAQVTGLPSATDPIQLVQERGARAGMLLCYPVFEHDTPNRKSDALRGFAMAVLSPQSTLDQAMGSLDADNAIVYVDWFLLSPDQPPRCLATWPQAGSECSAFKALEEAAAGSTFSHVLPLFIFGQPYAIVVRAGPASLAAHPARAGWIVMLVGLVLTCAATAFIAVMDYRRSMLQHEVQMQTKALEMSRWVSAAARREESRTKTLLDLSQMTHLTQEQIAEYALNTGVRLTESKIGYIAFTSDDEATLTMAHWSKSAMEQCQIVDRAIVYKTVDTGLWGEAIRQRRPIITNDYRVPNPCKKGTPEGHVPLIRHMNVPVFDGDHIVAVAGVANKDADYTSDDVAQLSLLMDGMWRIIRRKQTEEALRISEEKHRTLYESSRDAILVVASAESHFVSGNPAAVALFGARDEAEFCQMGPVDTSPEYQPDGERSSVKAAKAIERAAREGSYFFEWTHHRFNGDLFIATVLLTRIEISGKMAFLATVRDVSRQRQIEDEQRALEVQLAHAQRLESVGQLAAGIAHEINTPTQFVSDNTRFLGKAFPKLEGLLTKYSQLLTACQVGQTPVELVSEIEQAARTMKLDYLLKQIPEALSDSLEGLERITKIVRAMKDFSHPGQQGMASADLNKAIESTVTVARNEWKYVADMTLDLDPELPTVPCMLADFNQVILNLVVNAAHAIEDVVGRNGTSKGRITVSTRSLGSEVEVCVGDTGTGIPEAYRGRVFDHFFTTKEVGKGTGQGLAIARQVIVEKHHGTLVFETELGKGTRFIIRLPVEQPAGESEEACAHEQACSTC